MLYESTTNRTKGPVYYSQLGYKGELPLGESMTPCHGGVTSSATCVGPQHRQADMRGHAVELKCEHNVYFGPVDSSLSTAGSRAAPES
jgi:hypothetical protein